MTGMTGPRGNYADGEVLHGADLNADLVTLLANDEQAVIDMLGGYSTLISGGALTNGASGMVVNTASAVGYDATGTRFSTTPGTVTLSSGSAAPRYDVVYVATGTYGSTNPSSSNPTVVNTASAYVIQGTSGGGIPTLSQSNYCQIGYVAVPASATSILNCTLYSVPTPNSQGPLSTLFTLGQHVQQSFNQSVDLHGFEVTTPGGTQVTSLAQTDVYGGVGKANSMGYFGANSAYINVDTAASGASYGTISFNSNGPTGAVGAVIEYNPPTSGDTTNRLSVTESLTSPLGEFAIGATTTTFRGSPYNTPIFQIRTDLNSSNPGTPWIRVGDAGNVSVFINPATGGNVYLAWDVNGTLNIGSTVNLQNPGTKGTAPIAGSAAALPTNPAGYVQISIGGSVKWIPYYD